MIGRPAGDCPVSCTIRPAMTIMCRAANRAVSVVRPQSTQRVDGSPTIGMSKWLALHEQVLRNPA
jgi:hypothetical protein